MECAVRELHDEVEAEEEVMSQSRDVAEDWGILKDLERVSPCSTTLLKADCLDHRFLLEEELAAATLALVGLEREKL